MWVHGVSHCSTCHLSRIEYPKMRAVKAQQGENLHTTTTSFLTGRPKCIHYPNIVVWVKLLNISSKIGSHSAKGEQERSQSGSRWEICISWLLYGVCRRVAKIYTDMDWIDVGTTAHYAHTNR